MKVFEAVNSTPPQPFKVSPFGTIEGGTRNGGHRGIWRGEKTLFETPLSHETKEKKPKKNIYFPVPHVRDMEEARLGGGAHGSPPWREGRRR